MTKLYLKYSHLPSLQDSISPRVEDLQHLSHEEAERVKEWFQDHTSRRQSWIGQGSGLPLILVEAGVTDEEASSSTWLDMSCKENFIVSVIICCLLLVVT